MTQTADDISSAARDTGESRPNPRQVLRDVPYIVGFYALAGLLRTTRPNGNGGQGSANGRANGNARTDVRASGHLNGSPAPLPAGASTLATAGDRIHGRRGPRPLRFWRELAYIVAFYGVYSVVRNTQGSAAVSAGQALANAVRVVRWERMLGIYREQAIQHAFLGNRMFVELWNNFYGTFHFIVTGFALILLFRKFPTRYRRWRNALGFTTAFALVGFALYPLMPPRLLPHSYGFVDTLRTYGAVWNFDSGAVHKISNQYAAMPSLHFAWAAWSALALIPVLRHAWAKVLAGIYPALTLFAIVVTANHYFLDAAGGAAILCAGTFLGFWLAGWTERRGATATPRARNSPAAPAVPAMA